MTVYSVTIVWYTCITVLQYTVFISVQVWFLVVNLHLHFTTPMGGICLLHQWVLFYEHPANDSLTRYVLSDFLLIWSFFV